MKTVLSIDVAKNKSMIMLMNNDGEILIDTKEIKHNLGEFEKVKEEIEEINPENLTVFMESTGTYHLPVVNDKIRMYKKWNLTMYKNVQR